MNVFTIDSDNNITVHATKKAARATGAANIDTRERLADLIGPDNKRLVQIWNSLTGVAPVKKFTSRAIAAKRIFTEVQKLASPDAGATTGNNDLTTSAPAARSTSARSARSASPEPKSGSKKQILLALISRKNGASLEELTAALAWQKHSVRGFITTLGKTINIESFKTDDGVRTYRASQAA